MPVTFQPWGQIETRSIQNAKFATSTEDIVTVAAAKDHHGDAMLPRAKVLQASFNETAPVTSSSIISNNNGFVRGMIQAYSEHHHLTIRPDDIWLAILTQFSSYVNAHAEQLRGQFVAHEGQKELLIEYNFEFSYSQFALDMVTLLEKNVVDPTLKDWIIPQFTTTTVHDNVMASIVMMGTLQNYFRYYGNITCGIPSVTLLGEKADYEDILSRIGKLQQYGKEPTQFANVLTPILRRFIRCFDHPEDKDLAYFWRRIFTIDDSICGVTEYLGWINAFCFWDEKGRMLYRGPENQTLQGYSPAKIVGDSQKSWETGRRPYRKSALELDGIQYSSIDSQNIPPGWIKVPAKVCGQDVEMFAGSVAIEYSSKHPSEGKTDPDSLQPLSGWWIQEKLEEKELKSPNEERDRQEALQLQKLIEELNKRL